jgi:lysine/ornithine N-monooxygenase
MLHDIWVKYKRRIFFGNHRVVKIQSVERANVTYWLTDAVCEEKRIQFKSKHVVLATGSDQVISLDARSYYGLKPKAVVVNSDQVLKDEGFSDLARKIREFPGKAKVAILGGSHSAFSAL